MNHKHMNHEHSMDMSHMQMEEKSKEHAHKGEHEMHDVHNVHEGHNVSDFRNKFLIALILTVPVLLLSPTIQSLFKFSVSFTASKYLLFTLASIIVLYGGLPFYKGALKELKDKNYGMMTLVTIAVLSGYLYSLGTTFFFVSPDFYWEISTLVLFLLFGHWMEMRSVTGATSALSELAKLIPPTANLITSRGFKEVSTDELRVNDLILVKPGEKVPIDGIIIEGGTTVNESLITGESKPISKSKGDKVIGGSINFNGTIKVRVAKTGEDTVISQIIALVKEAQSSKPKTQKLADKAANYLTLAAISIGILTFAYWALLSSQTTLFALTMAITVIVIACPHALGLAIPIVTTISTTLAAKSGILIKDMQAVETADKLDYIIFDKTGTLTEGVFKVTDVRGDKNTLKYAAAVESYSEHIIAQGIVQKAEESKIPISKIINFKAIPGKGASAIVGLKEIYIGNNALLKELKIINTLEEDSMKLASQGKTVVFVADKKKLIGVIALSDVIRKESKEAINELKKLGIKTAMLTGDNKETANYVANELGIDEYYSEVLPNDKSEYVKELQTKGIVAFVGDGINDAPALTQANLGIAIGAGTDVAIQSAQVVLVKDSPLDVSKFISLSKKTKTKMKQNLWWAAGYNIIAIPVAAGILSPLGIFLRPEWGALIMAASSIIVVSNSLLLKITK